VGYFGAWLLETGTWTSAEAPVGGEVTSPWLHVEIHDSDWAAIRYSPSFGGRGVAYIGMTPRIYFEDETASAPTDRAAESRAIAAWVANVVGGDSAQLQPTVASYLAEDRDPDWESILPLDDSPSSMADEDVFVEQRVARFLEATGLGVPEQYFD
jgi:hypothetical protein